MKSWVWEQSKMEPCSGVPLNDRGFRYGQHLFETLVAREGRVLFVEEHCKRLATAASHHGFPFSQEGYEGILHFLKKTSFPPGMIRLYLTAGEGTSVSSIVKPGIFVFWEEAIFPSLQDLEKGATLVSLEQPVGTSTWGEKTGNYWEHIRALKQAQEQGASEGLIFDKDDNLISAAMANVVIWWKDDSEIILVRPLLNHGAREGVVCSWISEQGMAVHSRSLKRHDLEYVRAMAITNSRLGVMPVAMLNGRVLPEFSCSLLLAHHYLKKVIYSVLN